MDTFVAHPHNLDFNNGSFYKSLDNYKKANNFKDFKDFEFLIMNDGSTDETSEILNTYSYDEFENTTLQ